MRCSSWLMALTGACVLLAGILPGTCPAASAVEEPAPQPVQSAVADLPGAKSATNPAGASIERASSGQSAVQDVDGLATSVDLGDKIKVSVEDGEIVVASEGTELLRVQLLAWSPLFSEARGVQDPTGRLFDRDWFHLRHIAFLDLSAGLDSAEGTVSAIRIVDGADFAMVEQVLRPHRSMGGDSSLSLTTWQSRVEVDGKILYLALLRLDRVPGQPVGDGAISFTPATATAMAPGVAPTPELAPVPDTDLEMLSWPLAVVSAHTRRELLARMGQALLMYDGAGTRPDPARHWRVPALCALCQQQSIDEVDLGFQEHDSDLLLKVRTIARHPDHARPSAEGLQINGIDMAPWFTGERDNEGWFTIPFGQPTADELLRVAEAGTAEVGVWTEAGQRLRPVSVVVQLDGEFQERLFAKDLPEEPAEWPTYLSTKLVSSWPNPFRESTTIEVTVPSTVGEAFDFEDAQARQIDLEAAPPFGSSPVVSVKVYSVSGKLVSVLDSEVRDAGRFTVSWNGQDLAGRLVASGAYFIHVQIDEWSVTRRVLLLRN